MRSTRILAALFTLFFAGALAQGAQLSGTVTNKTTGKTASGDTVVLVEPMTGMTEVARTTVDARLFAEVERRIAQRGKYQRGRAANVLGFSVPDLPVALAG